MRSLYRNILTIGRLSVLIFFLANSGFTVVLYHCTMEEMDCCGKMSDACSTVDPPQASRGAAVTAGDNCHSLLVAGGLKTDPTIVGKESSTRVIKVDLVAGFSPTIALSSVPSRPQLFSSTASKNVSPPAVDTYLLNSSFLI